jgi:hypothetical protein
MGSSKRRILPFCVALAAGATGCRSTPAEVTALRLVTTWTDLKVDQLEFTISDPSTRLMVGPERRPQPPRPLTPGSDVVIYFGDERAGSEVTCTVNALSGGKVVAAGETHVRLVARAVATAQLVLTAGPAGKSDGSPCEHDAECPGQHCVDGVCCQTTCSGTCLSCNVPGKQGTCSPVPEGARHPLCADQGAENCSYDGTCDGRGSCRKYPSGTRCRIGACDGSSITAEGACDGDGHCATGPVVTCAPFSCDPSSGAPRCYSRCTSDDQCVKGRQCMAGSCGTKLAGAVCGAGSECSSGFCVDGVCCDSVCAGPCLSCTQLGSVGMCRPAPEGLKDPRGLCPDEGATSCGRTGTCNANGGCARYPTSTVCHPASCSGTVLHSASRCDGAGLCVPGGDLTCAPFACAAGACNSTCQKNEDCAPGQVCDLATRSCGKKGTGQPCSTGTECQKGFCVDGVCCDTACQGPCRSCVLGQTPGRCSNTPANAPDPRNACKDLGKAKCDSDGTCDGRGGCHKYPPGTVCGAGSCNATTNIRTLGRVCAGGTCAAGQTVSCGAYRCNGAVCFSACSSDAECVAPNTCNAGACTQRGMGSPCSPTMPCPAPLFCNGSTCQLKGDGLVCGADAECTSGHCSDGVCCENGPCGLCQSCNVPMFVGLCHALPAGAADARCATDPPSTCHQDGTCDGGGACRLHPAGTACGVASCAGQLRNNPRTCDGMGTCQDSGTTDCAPFTCDPATSNCFVSCSAGEQCCCGPCGGDSTCH